MADHPEIKGTITLPDGSTSEFSIGDVAGEIGWQQWGATEARLYQTNGLVEALCDAARERLESNVTRIETIDGQTVIHPPFDIGPRLMPSYKLADGSRVSVTAVNRDEEGRVVYLWAIDGPDGKQLATGVDLRSGVGNDVQIEAMFGVLADFLSAWVEALRYPGSDNRGLFPDELREWAEANAEEFYLAVGEGVHY